MRGDIQKSPTQLSVVCVDAQLLERGVGVVLGAVLLGSCVVGGAGEGEVLGVAKGLAAH